MPDHRFIIELAVRGTDEEARATRDELIEAARDRPEVIMVGGSTPYPISTYATTEAK